jgi:hypothetical protein
VEYESEKLDAETPYSALLGGSSFCETGTRRDIAQAVEVLSQLVSSHRVEHWNAAKPVRQNLAATPRLYLLYEDRTNHLLDILIQTSLVTNKSEVLLPGLSSCGWSGTGMKKQVRISRNTWNL